MSKPTPPNRAMRIDMVARRVRVPVETTLLNPHESAFQHWAESEGWSVTKRGWPDFICRRNGELMAVEVKGGKDGLRSEQIAAMRDLQDAGIPTYMWMPETGLTQPVRSKGIESLHALRAENAQLRSMIGELVGIKARVDRIPGDEVKRLRWGDDEALALEQVAAMCNAKHHSHRSSVPNERMNLCAWLVAMRDKLSIETMAGIVGIGPVHLQRQLNVALVVREEWLHRRRHNALKHMGGVCADCARAG